VWSFSVYDLDLPMFLFMNWEKEKRIDSKPKREERI